jgi:hypothetical protein
VGRKVSRGRDEYRCCLWITLPGDVLLHGGLQVPAGSRQSPSPTDANSVFDISLSLKPSYVHDAIRAGAPKIGFKPDKRVVALTR